MKINPKIRGYFSNWWCRFYCQIFVRIKKLNNKVICFDNLSTGKKANIQEFTFNTNFKFLEGDIRIIKDIKMHCKNIDYVLHQAALRFCS